MLTSYFFAFLCVLGLAVGQLLFKASASALAVHGSFTSLAVAVPLVGAMCLYGVTSVAWVWILRTVELGRVYPIMAAAFILVPLGSFFFFGERFPPQYIVGVGLIAIGILVIAHA